MKQFKKFETYNKIKAVKEWLVDALQSNIAIALRNDIELYLEGLKELEKEWRLKDERN